MNKTWIIYGLIGFGWLFFTSLANDIFERISGKDEICETGRGEKHKKYNLVSFNDALAQEVIKIKSDLIKIRLNQDNYGEDVAPPSLKSRANYENYCDWSEARENVDFFGMWIMCTKYPSSFLCNMYKTPTGSWGRIIIALDGIYPDEIFNLGGELGDFDAKQLRQLHSYKIHKIKKDMKFSVSVCEPGEIAYPNKIRSAVILSINEDSKYDYLLTIEISLYSYDERAWHISSRDEKIIRSFGVISHKFCDFILDKEHVDKEEDVLKKEIAY